MTFVLWLEPLKISTFDQFQAMLAYNCRFTNAL